MSAVIELGEITIEVVQKDIKNLHDDWLQC